MHDHVIGPNSLPNMHDHVSLSACSFTVASCLASFSCSTHPRVLCKVYADGVCIRTLFMSSGVKSPSCVFSFALCWIVVCGPHMPVCKRVALELCRSLYWLLLYAVLICCCAKVFQNSHCALSGNQGSCVMCSNAPATVTA